MILYCIIFLEIHLQICKIFVFYSYMIFALSKEKGGAKNGTLTFILFGFRKILMRRIYENQY